MATITFNPHDPVDTKLIASLLGKTAPAAAPTAPAAAPTAPAAAVMSLPDVDVYGMAWDAEIHSSPASITGDGSWRVRRGKKEEYEAAVAKHNAAKAADAAHNAAKAVATLASAPSEYEAADAAHNAAPAIFDMFSPPLNMFAAAAPTTPPAPIEYETMAKRFMQAVNDKRITNYEQVYSGLSVTSDDLEVNQTSIARLWHYMNAIDDGQDHDGAVRHALGSV